MEINFEKQGATYVAQFEVPGDFNLHLERSNGGVVKVYQRGCSSGEYDLAYTAVLDKIIDYDFGALVYPKYIKVVSGSEVVSAYVNFNEGGGSGSGSGESTPMMEYYRIKKIDSLVEDAFYQSFYVNGIAYGIPKIVSTITYMAFDDGSFENVKKMAFPNCEFVVNDGGNLLFYEDKSWKKNYIKVYSEMEGIDENEMEEYFNSIFEPITKEEFYTIENNDIPV